MQYGGDGESMQMRGDATRMRRELASTCTRTSSNYYELVRINEIQYTPVGPVC